MQRFRKTEQGFTLVELLIVVAIIGILAAIAIPQFTKYRRNAAVAACNSDLRNCMSEAAALHAQNGSTEIECMDALPGNKLEGAGGSLKVFVTDNGTMLIALNTVANATGLSDPSQAPLTTDIYHSTPMNATIGNNSADCIMQGFNE